MTNAMRTILCSALLLIGLGGCDSQTDQTGAGGTSGAGGAGGGTVGTGGGTVGTGGGLSEGDCREDADCDATHYEYCARPGETPACGACYIGDCLTDDDCEASLGAGYICGPVTDPCSCGEGGECVLGCAAAGCPPEADCGEDDRCVTRSCAVDEDCGDVALRCAEGLCKVPGCFGDGDCDPPNTLCNTDTYSCYRVTCTSDADCAGYCVMGQCFSEPGHCEMPAA
jgi:hypothetical protein